MEKAEKGTGETPRLKGGMLSIENFWHQRMRLLHRRPGVYAVN